MVQGKLRAKETDKKKKVLVRTDEKVSCSLKLEKELQAPVQKGQKIGEVRYMLEMNCWLLIRLLQIRMWNGSVISGVWIRCFTYFFIA